MAMDEDFQHPPKQLEIIELKLEIDSEKERKTKSRHETHIMGLQTSKYTSISFWGFQLERASHMGNGTEVDEGKQREKQSISGGPIHLTKDFNYARIGVTIGLEIGVHNFGRALSDLRWMILVQIIGNVPDWTKLLRVSSPMGSGGAADIGCDSEADQCWS